ncbi:MAG TPA: DNA mismatch repair protein MutS [Flavobacteriales bacterium]|nr:DNA mismatch repair protein MutS [Flavobacteriales bacterium]
MATKTKKSSETPLMKQYHQIKTKYPDALLLFRIGDFYETFGEDAKKASNILGIVLTKRANGAATYIDLAGFPHHSLDTYLPKLVRAGLRVAICDQLEDPKLTKKIVKRGVTELVTPGVSFNNNVLEQNSNNFLAAIHIGKKACGAAFLDISTGEFLTAEGGPEYIDKLLQSMGVNEVIFQKEKRNYFTENFGNKFCTFSMEDWVFTAEFAEDLLLKHFKSKSLKGFGIQDMELGIIAAGAALQYLKDTHHEQVLHISKISRIEEKNYVWIDRFTIRNLELFTSPHPDAVTLIDILDHTTSPMGARMLKRWLALPLINRKAIEERLDVVGFLVNHEFERDEITSHISQIGDLERIISKVAVNRINPREVIQLKRALTAIEPIKSLGSKVSNKHLKEVASKLNPCANIIEKIEHEIQSEPPVLLNKGNVISKGVSKELDELRDIAFSGKDHLIQIQNREIQNTGIPSLKVSFNNVFGYFIEVTNTHKAKVPESWIRKQTLVNAERYITEELKEYEAKILGAEEKILALEVKLYNDLVESMKESIQIIQKNALLIAQLDCLASFSELANKNDYVKPQITKSKIIDIKQGRHPVIEQGLPAGESYVANDVILNDKQQIMIITGPNMSGKSALLRQTALIVILAQIGSFVPAKSATIGIIDKLFTRVGASDNISSGESTFMVEMNETASILNNLSENSLVLLDEIGRGTSTYDGISIAWAISEFLHDHPKYKAKTMFATHYHEMNEMAKSYNRIKNYNVSVKEVANKVIFLRKLEKGGSEHSFGIHVAKMAGMPEAVVLRAGEIMTLLEQTHSNPGKQNKNSKPTKKTKKEEKDFQLSFFSMNDPNLEEIKNLLTNTDINTLTPVEALLKLAELKKIAGN